jgi:NAD(P)H-nitrite reductase large subunit
MGEGMTNPDDKLNLDEIKARIRVVCICKGIKMGKICDAIQKGCDTVEKVNKACGSGNGGCGATRCRPVIAELIARGGKPLTGQQAAQHNEDDSEDDDDFFWKP